MADDKKQQQPQNALMDPKTIIGELQKMRGQIEAALPRHITPDRMARIAVTAAKQNPKLFRCTKESFFGAIITASQLGLEPGVNGQCYLVPYYNKQSQVYICTFIPGWKGYMDLVSRTGRATAWTQAVFDGDDFDYEYGSKPFIEHKPGKHHGDPKFLSHTYAVGVVKGMEDCPIIEVWPEERIWEHRNQNNKVGDDHYSYKHPEMYARKIPLLQVVKYLPSSVELINASQLDLSGTEGRQRLTIEGAFTADYTASNGQDVEIEFLMEKLNWDNAKREEVRKSYEDRPEELLKHLRKEAEPIDNGKGKPAKNGKPTETVKDAQTQQAQQTQPDKAPVEEKRQEETKTEPKAEPDQQSNMFSNGGGRPQPGTFKF